MKKFTTLGNTNKTIETSDNRHDFIKNLIEESLTIENGIILGKDILTNTINKIMDVNESKTKISVLENIKFLSTRNLNIQTINESIEMEKNNIKNIKFETIEKVEEEFELVKEDKKCDNCEKCDCDENDKIKPDEDEDEDKIEDNEKETKEKEDLKVVESFGKNVYITDSDYTNDIFDLAKLVESIKSDDNKE